jgi:hypothetical protein
MSNETKAHDFKVGDVVIMKSGSPYMVIVKLPAAGEKDQRATCTYWAAPTDQVKNDVPIIALETQEAFIARQQKLQQHAAALAAAAANPIIQGLQNDERVLCMTFSSDEDMQNFLKKTFESPDDSGPGTIQ